MLHFIPPEQPWRRIKAIALDVDGVLTDGGMWWGALGEEFKRFAFTDIMGISIARQHGLKIALISGESSPLIDRYAAKLRIEHTFAGCSQKDVAVREFARRVQVDLADTAFMGDDVNDLPAMKICGLAAAPADARPTVREAAGFLSVHNGGYGAVRELIEALLVGRQLPPAMLMSRSEHAEAV